MIVCIWINLPLHLNSREQPRILQQTVHDPKPLQVFQRGTGNLPMHLSVCSCSYKVGTHDSGRRCESIGTNKNPLRKMEHHNNQKPAKKQNKYTCSHLPISTSVAVQKRMQGTTFHLVTNTPMPIAKLNKRALKSPIICSSTITRKKKAALVSLEKLQKIRQLLL